MELIYSKKWFGTRHALSVFAHVEQDDAEFAPLVQWCRDANLQFKYKAIALEDDYYSTSGTLHQFTFRDLKTAMAFKLAWGGK